MVLEALDVRYELPDRPLLAGASLSVGTGEVVAIVGPSGSGKTTLLQVLAGIATPVSGTIVLDGLDLTAASVDRRARKRLERVGFVFQFGELLPELKVRENVGLPLRLIGRDREEADRAADEMLERVDLAGAGDRSPTTLSGGEVQRVAVARALVNGPALVLADEPTGSLDSSNAKAVCSLLVETVRERSAALVLVTHNDDIAASADRILRLSDGLLVLVDAGR